ncbi:MAG: putative toxin-antitoxin system toxin component, PIN family [Nitrospirota bacterium]
MKRVVLDTNVTISAFFWGGYPRLIYDQIRERKLVMLLSNEMEKEFIRVLGYSKFGLTPKEIWPFIRNLRANAEFVETRTKVSLIVTDQTDNMFIECAVALKAQVIITGDRLMESIGE